jgi:hypothetical protein
MAYQIMMHKCWKYIRMKVFTRDLFRKLNTLGKLMNLLFRNFKSRLVKRHGELYLMIATMM